MNDNKLNTIIKEACVEGFSEAARAMELGADRIELCENLAVGGTTPSWGTIIACKKNLKIPTVVMIRPRGGDFHYTKQELEIMAHDIDVCRSVGIYGIAVGTLTENHEIDFDALHYLLERSGQMQITFHKAIDAVSDFKKEYIELLKSGLVNRVLTSGGAPTALEGAQMIKEIIGLSNEKIKIVVAGKVTSENLSALLEKIPANEFHGKKIIGNLSYTY